ncbi:hypothetical protein M408DRAFT_129807 [Serendipita vermifera MAFF 305830]|uniref:Uncharacterized protein n=1 Tax=Serendipita vermifera MAFF 305830 TaxID=933852 RepID=A0A0C2W292_SERVB|nr:hypothetical protein M408DRAFT_129807 [Serendipita vermifera MAFF 305830]
MPPGFENCQVCGKSVKTAGGGHTNHLRACRAKAQKAEEEKRKLREMREDYLAHLQQTEPEQEEQNGGPNEDVDFNYEDNTNEPMDFEPQQPSPDNRPYEGSPPLENEYHPRTGLPPPIVDTSEERSRPLPPKLSLPPFAPFATEADFLVAEMMVNTVASNDEINFLLKIRHDPCLGAVQLARVTYFTELRSSPNDRAIGRRRYEEEEKRRIHPSCIHNPLMLYVPNL